MGHAFTKYVYGPEGQRGTVRCFSDSQWACPICGVMTIELHGDDFFLPYYPDPEQGSPSHAICRCCNVQYGLEDFPWEDDASLDHMWSRLRIEWLNRVGWDEPSLAQLRENLGLTREQPEAERAEYEADPAWPRGGDG